MRFIQGPFPKISEDARYFADSELVKEMQRTDAASDHVDGWRTMMMQYRGLLDDYLAGDREDEMLRNQIEGTWFTLFLLKKVIPVSAQNIFGMILPLQPRFGNIGWERSIVGMPLPKEEREPILLGVIDEYNEARKARDSLVEKMLEMQDPDNDLCIELEDAEERLGEFTEIIKNVLRISPPKLLKKHADKIPVVA